MGLTNVKALSYSSEQNLFPFFAPLFMKAGEHEHVSLSRFRVSGGRFVPGESGGLILQKKQELSLIGIGGVGVGKINGFSEPNFLISINCI